MSELWLLRHALPVSRMLDPGLSDVGRDQADRVARWLRGRGIDAMVTSPFLRARETAFPIEQELGLVAEVVDDLREWQLDGPNAHYDAVEDMSPDDPRLRAVAEGRYEDYVPDLDTVAFQQRVVAAVDSVFDAHPSGRVLVSTHGGVICAYLAHVIGTPRVMWFNPEYTSIARVQKLPGGRVVVRSVNETAHLDDRLRYSDGPVEVDA